MEVKNRSGWRTLDLKRVLLRVARPLTSQYIPAKVEIIESRKGNFKGVWMRPTNAQKRATSTRGCLIIVPKAGLNPNMLALTAFDTFRHGRTQARELRPLTQILREYEWAMDPKYIVRLKPPARKKTRSEVIEAELKKLDRDIKRWTRKMKLANTKLKGLRKRQTYYTKQLAKQRGT